MSDDQHARPLDPGLANERTALASSRTALSFVVIAGLTARLGLHGGMPVLGVVAGALLLVVAGALAADRAVAYSARHDAGLAGRLERARPARARALAAASTAAAVIAFVLAIAAQ